jgi:hypothetical protein
MIGLLTINVIDNGWIPDLSVRMRFFKYAKKGKYFGNCNRFATTRILKCVIIVVTIIADFYWAKCQAL